MYRSFSENFNGTKATFLGEVEFLRSVIFLWVFDPCFTAATSATAIGGCAKAVAVATGAKG